MNAPETPDDTLTALTVEEAAHLRELVGASLGRVGLPVTVLAGHVEGDGGQVFGLAPLSRTVAGVERRFWAGIVDDHFRALLAAQHDPFDAPIEHLLEHTYLRLRPAELTDLGGFDYARPALPGVVETLALDQPEAVVAYTDSDVDRLGLAALRAAGLANLGAVLPEEHQHVAGVDVLFGAEYLASTALLLPEVVRRVTGERELPNGVLFTVPGQDHLLFHVLRDHSVVDVFEPIVGLTHRLYDEVHERISPELYFHLDGEVTQVTGTGEDGNVVIGVDGSFADALERVRHIG